MKNLFQKTIITFLTVALFCLIGISNVYSQSGCGVPSNLPDHLPDQSKINSNSEINKNGDGFDCNYEFRVHVYVVRASDGTNSVEGGINNYTAEGLVSQIMTTLNDGFDFPDMPYDEGINPNPDYISDITFVPTETVWEYLDDDYVRGENDTDQLLLNNYGRSDAINIFLQSREAPSTGINNATITPTNSRVGLTFHVAPNSSTMFFNFTSLVHEMGHVFGLLHTWNDTPHFNYEGNLELPNGAIQTPTASEPFGTQCASEGDFVCDTYVTAQNLVSLWDCELLYQDNCVSRMPENLVDDCSNTDVDEFDLWPIYTVPGEDEHINFMAYAAHPCRDYFTPGQSQRMQLHLECTPELQLTSCIIEAPEISASCKYGSSGSIYFSDYLIGGDGILTYSCIDCNGYQEGYYFEGLATGNYTVQSFLNDCLIEEFTVFVPNVTYDFDYNSPVFAFSGTYFNSQTISFADDLIIPPGVDLTISNSNLSFADGAGIIVNPGATLTLNDCEVRNHICSSIWSGIEVHGVTSSTQFGLDANDQGHLILNNTLIEKAEIGIVNYDKLDDEFNPSTSGGIIHVENNSKFLNCNSAVKLVKYNSADDAYQASFYNSDFIWDTNFIMLNTNEEDAMVKLDNVKLISFNGCKFINTNPTLFATPYTDLQKAAIYGEQSSISMKDGCGGVLQPCPVNDIVDSSIEGFNYGVVLIGGKSTSIQETDFNCYRGIYMINNIVPRITENNFGILPASMIVFAGTLNVNDPYWLAHYGLYLDYSTGYWIEANVFDHSGLEEEESSGAIIKSSGNSNNEIYGNSFNDIQFSTICYDDNKGLGFDGLKLNCNEYALTKIAISVQGTDDYVGQGNWGIAALQGVPGLPGVNPISAGNQFELSSYIDLLNELDFIAYYAFSGENVNLVTNTFVIENPTVKPNGCVSQFDKGIGLKRYNALAEKELADGYKEILNSLIDGGDSQAMLTEVILSDYTNALELYHRLMEESPNLSEEVIIQSINKEFELPSPLLTLILESNPHAAKSEKIQTALDNRMIPLDEYQRAQIQVGLSLISSKEELEGRFSYHQNRHIKFLNQAIILMMEDESSTDKLAELYALIEGIENVDHYYLITDILIDRKDYDGARNVLSEIAENFDMSTQMEEEHLDYLTLYDILINHEESKKSTLSEREIDQLELIGMEHDNRAAGMAISLLIEYDELDHIELLVKPEEGNNTDQIKPQTQLKVVNKTISIYPNPAQSFIVIQQIGNNEDTQAQIIDVNGKVVLQSALKSSEKTRMLDVSNLDNGTYIVVINSSNGKIHQEKIQIQR